MTGGKGKGQGKIVHNMKYYRGRKLWLRPFLTSTLYTNECQLLLPAALPLERKPPVPTE